MKVYYAIVHKEPESAFGVSFPDLPSIFSAADEAEDILAHAAQALRLWAEDTPLPAPSPLQALLDRADVHSALAEGAFIVRIPLIEDDTRVVRINATFETGLLRAKIGRASCRERV